MGATEAMTLLDQFNHLPTVPKVVRDLVTEFERPMPNLDRVANLIGSDPVLATKLLRLANSAFYHRAGTVSRIQDAVIFLGTNAVRNLVLAAGLTSSVSFPADFPRASFWRYSLHTAVAAREIARSLHVDTECAFTIGLMRAIGEPLMYSVMGQDMRAIDRTGSHFYQASRANAERERLRFSHVDLGADLALRWHFPTEMVAVLRQSQAPDDTAPGFRMASAVALGAYIAGEYEALNENPQQLPGATLELLESIGLQADTLLDMAPLPELSEGLEILVS